jgi:hypothetical protein
VVVLALLVALESMVAPTVAMELEAYCSFSLLVRLPLPLDMHSRPLGWLVVLPPMLVEAVLVGDMYRLSTEARQAAHRRSMLLAGLAVLALLLVALAA